MNKIALQLPDALLLRYQSAGELEHVTAVEKLNDGRIRVTLAERTDLWRDLGGGLGYVPDVA